MNTQRLIKSTFVLAACLSIASPALAENEAKVSTDHAIMQQAADAMLFQAVFADIALALSKDEGVLELAHYIHELSAHGSQSIREMAEDCGITLDPQLDATAWRRVLALREISTAALREQVYLDGQLMRLYEARQENLNAMVRAEHAIVKSFAMRSEPEIEALILKVRAVAMNPTTSAH